MPCSISGPMRQDLRPKGSPRSSGGAGLPRGHPGGIDGRERGRRQGPVSVPARAWRREARRSRHRPRTRHVLERWQVMSVTFARSEADRGARIFRGPLVSVLSVAGFMLIWFIAAEIAQSRLLPGPGAVLDYIYQETVHGDLLTELGITLWRVAASFVVAMAIGSVIGLAMGQMPALNRT